MRVGMGYDVHRLSVGRKLIIGGVEIPYEKGLLGHSDADVLLHAIMDALLGSAALGDIGKHFARLAHALGAYVIGIKRTYSPCPEYVDELHLQEDIKALLPRADARGSYARL